MILGIHPGRILFVLVTGGKKTGSLVAKGSRRQYQNIMTLSGNLVISKFLALAKPGLGFRVRPNPKAPMKPKSSD